jgi:hypothetical protein
MVRLRPPRSPHRQYPSAAPSIQPGGAVSISIRAKCAVPLAQIARRDSWPQHPQWLVEHDIKAAKTP